MKEHVMIASLNGNSNVGLYGLVTNTHILLGKEVHTYHEKLEKLFEKPIAHITIAGTSLIGVFCVWANNKLLVPSIIFEEEKELLEELGLKVVVIDTKLTCLGNNILVGTKSAILNPDFKPKEIKQIEKAIGMPCNPATIMDIEAVGALGVQRGGKALFHRDIPPQTIEELEKDLGISITQGTINMGSPYIKSGILLGEDAFVVGNSSGGPEITNADEALGFLEE